MESPNMESLTYHLKDKALRTSINLLKHKLTIEKAMQSFKMIKLLNVTPTEFTISIFAGEDKRNGIIRQFFRKIARTSDLGKHYNKGLFIRKK